MTQPPEVYYFDNNMFYGGTIWQSLVPNAPEGSVAILGPPFTDPSATMTFSDHDLKVLPPVTGVQNNQFRGLRTTVTPINPEGDLIYLWTENAQGTLIYWNTYAQFHAALDPRLLPLLDPATIPKLFGRDVWTTTSSPALAGKGSSALYDAHAIGQGFTKDGALAPIVNAVYINAPTEIIIGAATGDTVHHTTAFNVKIKSYSRDSAVVHPVAKAPGVQMWRRQGGAWAAQTVQPYGTLHDILQAGVLPSSPDPANFFVWDGARWQPAVDKLWYADRTAPTTTMYKA